MSSKQRIIVQLSLSKIIRDSLKYDQRFECFWRDISFDVPLEMITRGTVVFWKVFNTIIWSYKFMTYLLKHPWRPTTIIFQTTRIKTMKDPKAIILKGALVWYRTRFVTMMLPGRPRDPVHVIDLVMGMTWSTMIRNGKCWLRDDFWHPCVKKKRHSTLNSNSNSK